MPLLGPVKLRQLLRNVGPGEEIFSFRGTLGCPTEVLGRPNVVSPFPRDDTDVAKDFPAQTGRDLPSQLEQRVRPRLCLFEAARCNAELNVIEGNL